MGWSIPVGSVAGTVVRIHITFLLFLVWIGGDAYVRGGGGAATETVLYVVLLFLCVVLHEFGHVFAARRYGVATPDITLLPIGGVARLERIPEDPGQELVIALAGPAVNLVIAALLFVWVGGLPAFAPADVANPSIGLAERLLVVNVFLAVFNMLPAFPMDGGRVLRALLSKRWGYARGTQMAAWVGQALAFGLGLLGLFGGNAILIFIGLFVYLGAASEGYAAQMRLATRGVRAREAMISKFERLSPASTIDAAIRCLIATTQHEFPVVDGAGRLRGVLTRDDMIVAMKTRGVDAPVIEVMRADIPIVSGERPLDEALRLIQERQLPAVGVIDADGRLIGLITPENIGEMTMIMAARGG